MRVSPTETASVNPTAAVSGALDGGALSAFGFDDPDGDGWLERFRDARRREPIGRIGPYEVIEEVGRGGQGVVYRARQPGLDRDVALKRLVRGALATLPMRERFGREIAAAAGLDHCNVVRVLSYEEIDGQPLMVMEWVDGVTLGEGTKARRHEGTKGARTAGTGDIRETLVLFAQICDGVHHAHQHGVIHRDLKPSNVIVDRLGRPRVLDFGLAAAVNRESHQAVDATIGGGPQFFGTIAYASPEHLRENPSAIEVRSDVYSLGVMLFELLTGQLPYKTDGALLDALEAIQSAAAPRPSSLNNDLPRELDSVVLKSLAKDKSERYASVEALAGDVRRFLACEPVTAHPPSAVYAIAKWARRNRVLAATIAAAVLVTLATTALSILAWRTAKRAQVEEHSARLVAERVSAFLDGTLAAAGAAGRGADVSMLQVLDDAARRAERELAGEPRVAAEVYRTIGETLRSLWRYRQAEPHLRKAYELAASLPSIDAEALARTTAAYGSVLTNLRDPRAVDRQREALELRKRKWGAVHPLVAESMTRLAYALHQAAQPPQYAESEAMFHEALAMYRVCLGPNHRDVGSCLHNLGWLYYSQRRLEDAAAAYEEALEVFRAVGDLEDPYYAECLHGYTSLLNLLNRYEENLVVVEDAIGLTRRIYGETAVRPLLLRKVVALQAVQRYDEAKDVLRQMLAGLCAKVALDESACASRLRTVEIELTITHAGQHGEWPILELGEILMDLPRDAQDGFLAVLGRLASLLDDCGDPQDAAQCRSTLAEVIDNRR
jgi:tetratricopeptide (TPR) repeat protein/tRNA A-37 threonylcarbamoyl transferase component Bud32